MHLIIKYKNTSFIEERNVWDWKVIILISIILSVISNFEKDEDFQVSQMMIRFSIILEAIGLLPQLSLMRVEKHIPHSFGLYLLTIACSRIARIGFWVFQLKFNYTGSTYYTLILADGFYLLMTGDIIYNFFKYKDHKVIPYN